MLPFALAIDFEGDQWTFFKPPHAALYELYGMDVHELAIWRPLAEHVVEQVGAGRPVLVELDSFYLPDTAGTAYRLAHTKTTVAVNEIDVEGRRLGYFHNAGYWRLAGDDFAELFQLAGPPHDRVLPPYVEFVRRRPGFASPRGPALAHASVELLRGQLQRAPRANPFPRFKARLAADLAWLEASPLERFHAYSFANLRQYGACFGLAEAHLAGLGSEGIAGFDAAAAEFRDISQAAKALQFQLARCMSRGKPLDLAPLDAMGGAWQRGMERLQERLR